ncbi:MAG: aminotransferase class-III [Caulobacteraceae bacterium]|nr:aminotransferase class-III [Caulobacteraceae bacterium]
MDTSASPQALWDICPDVRDDESTTTSNLGIRQTFGGRVLLAMRSPTLSQLEPSRATYELHLEQSHNYARRAADAIAGGVNSNVRLSGQRICFASGSGSKLTDIDGNEYIDFALGMGPTILGHAPPPVLKAVEETLQLGQLFAGQHPLELELAELLTRHIPSAERVRIGLTGSEMVQAALRLARAHTGRPGFIKFEGQYHGWFDNVLVNHAGPANDPVEGLPFPVHLQTPGQDVSSTSHTYVLPWNDLDAVRRFLKDNSDKVAAIITEPVMCNTGVLAPRDGYLQGLRELCDQYKVVLIFDEVITGFRLGLSGAQGMFGVLPDLSTFAKAFGGGFPVAALAGSAELMNLFANGVNHSGTYNSNLVSIAAGIATLQVLADDNGAAFERIERVGQSIIGGIREAAQRHGANLKVLGYGAVFHTLFTNEPETYDYASYKRADAQRQAVFLDALLPLGVRPTGRGTWFVSAAHTEEDAERTVRAVDQALSASA